MIKLLLKILYSAIVFVEMIIAFRIVLSFLNPDTSNTFVSWIYNASAYFINPFKGIVSEYVNIDNFSLELTPFVALLFFVITGFAISEIIKAFSKTE